MSGKVLAIISSTEPWGFVPESSVERAAHAATVAIDALDNELWLAKHPDDMREVWRMVEELIQRLTDTSHVALTRIEQWKEQ